MKLYMCVTTDKYKLPIAVADSFQQLADLLGVTRKSISDSRRFYRKQGKEGKYLIIEVEDDK